MILWINSTLHHPGKYQTNGKYKRTNSVYSVIGSTNINWICAGARNLAVDETERKMLALMKLHSGGRGGRSTRWVYGTFLNCKGERIQREANSVTEWRAAALDTEDRKAALKRKHWSRDLKSERQGCRRYLRKTDFNDLPYWKHFGLKQLRSHLLLSMCFADT